MTIHFVNSDFTTRLLLDNKTAAEAASKFQNLKASLKASGFCFGNIAPLLLTDNGSEFSMVSAYEKTLSTRLCKRSHKIYESQPCPQSKSSIPRMTPQFG